jgi:hypothetical protein
VCGAARREASGVKEHHAVTHVDRVSNESTIVQGNLDVLSVGGGLELDVESGTVGDEVLAGDLDAGRTLYVALKVGRCVDLVAELGDVGVLRVRGENRLFYRVGAGDQESAVEEEKSDTVVETGDGGFRSSSPALALGLVRVVEEDLESRVLGDAEALRAELSTVDPDAGTIGKEGSLDHTAAFGHRVHLPLRVGIKGLDTTAGWVTGSSNILVRATTADEDIRVVVVGAGQSHHDGATGVGIGAVGAGQISERTDDIASGNVEDLSRLGDLNEQVAILHQVHEWVHVVRLVLAQDLHGDGLALGGTIGVQHLVGGVVVLWLAGVETVGTAGGDEDLAIRHDLDRSIPAGSVKAGAGLDPVLTIHLAISSALKETDAPEAITNGRINEVKRSVATERNKATISKEDTSRAEGVGLVRKRGELLGGRVVFGGVGILAIGELEVGVVLDFVQEDNAAVGHETSVHGRHTRAALDLDGTRSGRSRRGAGSRSSLTRSFGTRTVLASLTTVRGSVTAVSVHGAARTLSPVTANSVIELGSTATIDSGDTSWFVGGRSRGLTKNRLSGGGD